MIELRVKTPGKGFLDITDLIEEKINIKNGFVYVLVPHTTCGLLIQENYDGSVPRDLISLLDKIEELKKDYEHDRIDNNAKAHLSSALLNSFLLIPIKDSRLFLGRWQRILLFEFDGIRERSIYLLFVNL